LHEDSPDPGESHPSVRHSLFAINHTYALWLQRAYAPLPRPRGRDPEWAACCLDGGAVHDNYPRPLYAYSHSRLGGGFGERILAFLNSAIVSFKSAVSCLHSRAISRALSITASASVKASSPMRFNSDNDGCSFVWLLREERGASRAGRFRRPFDPP